MEDFSLQLSSSATYLWFDYETAPVVRLICKGLATPLDQQPVVPWKAYAGTLLELWGSAAPLRAKRVILWQGVPVLRYEPSLHSLEAIPWSPSAIRTLSVSRLGRPDAYGVMDPVSGEELGMAAVQTAGMSAALRQASPGSLWLCSWNETLHKWQPYAAAD